MAGVEERAVAESVVGYEEPTPAAFAPAVAARLPALEAGLE